MTIIIEEVCFYIKELILPAKACISHLKKVVSQESRLPMEHLIVSSAFGNEQNGDPIRVTPENSLKGLNDNEPVVANFTYMVRLYDLVQDTI